ncbi:RES family NAD+ phosphorylase [Pedobacter arcticus]|uniref:RES family NAD+ phosphorylase n=1 Tax=Pedobacter arcticus TaxID=752140 RepID=UPI00030705D9|nr:RES family NAD+ phosphorylase [Pedobacter arcticus]
MQVYRITLAKFADSLQASGRSARWNGNQVRVIYAASSQSLSCLENVVHRTSLGLNQNFRLLSINIPDNLKISTIKLSDLKPDWLAYEELPYTQNIGNNWIQKNETAVLRVPSAIIAQEYNYLLNPNHPDFSEVKLLGNESFIFDSRIKS